MRFAHIFSDYYALASYSPFLYYPASFIAIRNLHVFTINFCTANTHGNATHCDALWCSSMATILRYHRSKCNERRLPSAKHYFASTYGTSLMSIFRFPLLVWMGIGILIVSLGIRQSFGIFMLP